MKKTIFSIMLLLGASFTCSTVVAASTRMDSTAHTQADSIKQIFNKAKQGDAAAQNQVGAWYYAGKNVKQDYDEAFNWWKKSALQGDVSAIGNLALCYQFGRGVERDSVGALRLYMKSIKEGNKQLLTSRVQRADQSAFDGVLGALCYQRGNGVAKDLNKAVELFGKAAKMNSVDAQREVALCMMNQNKASQAAQWFKQAASQNDLASTYYYGKLLQEGNGVAKDMQNAVIYLLKAAEGGYPQAQTEVGNLYSAGDGVVKNAETAASWYEKAACNGNVHGMWNLAVCSMKGNGLAQNFEKALFWYGEASALGYTRSFKKIMTENEDVKSLAFDRYVKGMKAYLVDTAENHFDTAVSEFKALEKAKVAAGKTMQGVIMANSKYAKNNVKKAVPMLQSASESDPAAAFYLATLYENGKGVDKDMPKAVELYAKSADAGYGPAQSYLGDIYYEGRGAEQSYEKAVGYYQQAYRQKQLTLNSTKRLASCYENGWGGLVADKQKAAELSKEERKNNVKALLNAI